MATEMRKVGIDLIGDMAMWGTHISLFYETKQDLLDTLIPFCRTGLKKKESCLWVVAEPLTIDEATNALTEAASLDRDIDGTGIEIASARDWFLQGGTFDGDRVTAAWYEKLDSLFAKSEAGVRATGDTTWLDKKDWKAFVEYEEGLNELIRNQRVAVLCTYPLACCNGPEILDVVRTHQFALVRRHGSWDVVETAGLKQAKAELKRLNEELEQRVHERTDQLMRASEALHEARAELAHVNRVTTMGQLTASIAHEVMQPIGATITNARTALRWLDAQPPNIEDARKAVGRAVSDGNRASEVIDRIRSLIRKAPPRKDSLDINKTIHEVIALTRSEAVRNGVLVETRLAEDLPLVQGDRVQLQQVILNLIINAIEAMSGASGTGRQLLINSTTNPAGEVLITVQDSGPGLSPEDLDRVFDAFYTTKSSGMGMGLSICRSIVEAHGGRIWASRAATGGASLAFSLPRG